MTAVFLKICDMVYAAGWMILAVLLLRLVLRRAPRRMICILWGLVALRLICPFSIKSSVSLIPRMTSFLPAAVLEVRSEAQDAERGSVDTATEGSVAVSNTEKESEAEGAGTTEAMRAAERAALAEDVEAAQSTGDRSSLPTVYSLGSVLWSIGLAGMLLYALVSSLRLRRRVAMAVRMEGEVYLCDALDRPFILGLIRPRIYLPSSLSEAEQEHVLSHERAHLRHADHWQKALGFALLSVYWFHPLVWAAYLFFSRDIELACDESVIAAYSMSEKKAYANTLLSCGMRRRLVYVYPLAFGEIGVRTRIKAILNYRKPALWIVIAAAAAGIIAAVCFLTDPGMEDAAAKEEELLASQQMEIELQRAEEQAQQQAQEAVLLAAQLNVEEERQRVEQERTEEERLRENSQAWLWPTESGEISGRYGERANGNFADHINIAGTPGDAVYAATDGKVRDSGYDGILGNYICIDTEDGAELWYSHLLRSSVSVGKPVRRGEEIGWLGQSGTATGANLALAVYRDGVSVDPLDGSIEWEIPHMQGTEDVEGWLRISLPEGYVFSRYLENIGEQGGALILPQAYEVIEGYDSAPLEWSYAGMISRIPAEQTGVIYLDGYPQPGGLPESNHTVTERLGIVGLERSNTQWSVIMLHTEHDLYTVPELGELEGQGYDLDTIDTTSAYWCFYFVKEGEPYYYILTLAERFFTNQEAIDIVYSVEIIE